MATQIADEIADTTRQLKKEADQEKELVDAEFIASEELDELVKEEETGTDEVGEQFVLTGEAEESALKSGDRL